MAEIRKYAGRWSVTLLEMEDDECRARAELWTKYKGNEANLFDGSVNAKLAGLRGELAFKALLEHLHVPFVYGGVDGKADDWDFKVLDKIYSLKTQRSGCGMRPSDTIHLNARQINHPADYYVFGFNLVARAGQNQSGREVVFLGCVEKKQFVQHAKVVKEGQMVMNELRHKETFVCKSEMLYWYARACKPLPFEKSLEDARANDGKEESNHRDHT
jgi:hypothetical protein